MDINSLKNFQVRSKGLDDLMGIRSDLKSLAAYFDDLKLPIPGWISTKLDELEIEVKSQVRADRLAEISKLKSRRAALMTADEKRQVLDAQITAMEESMK
jgi:hypothetical protein